LSASTLSASASALSSTSGAVEMCRRGPARCNPQMRPPGRWGRDTAAAGLVLGVLAVLQWGSPYVCKGRRTSYVAHRGR
jgi:hypothetical protein